MPADTLSTAPAGRREFSSPPSNGEEFPASRSPTGVKAWRVSAKKSKRSIEEPVTKIGGKPTLLGSVTWTNCKRCDAPMMFGAQFAKDEVLALCKYKLVALFFCTDWGCEPYLPYTGANAVLLMSGAPSPVVTIPAGPMTEYSVKLSTLRDKPDYEQASKASFASKVGGFPRWVQNEGQHACECGLSMVTIAQIDANLDDFVWGKDIWPDGSIEVHLGAVDGFDAVSDQSIPVTGLCHRKFNLMGDLDGDGNADLALSGDTIDASTTLLIYEGNSNGLDTYYDTMTVNSHYLIWSGLGAVLPGSQ